MANRFARFVEPAQAAPTVNRFARFAQDAAQESPTLNARASGSSGAVNKKAEAIWGGSFDDWKNRKEADDAERARMVAESEAGNVGSRRAQDFQRKVAALNKEGDQTGDYSADSLRAGRSLEMGMEQGREQIGAGLQFAGETPLALADFFGRIRPKGETEQDRSNPVTEAGKDIRGAAVARQQEIAPLMIDRPESLLSVQGAKYIAQSALQSAPTTGTGLAAAVISPAAGLSLMGAGAGSAKFADARAEDKGYWLSAEAGAAAAAAEVVPEMLPLGFLSGRLLKHLPGTAMKRMASSPAGRGALLSLSEGASEGVTELSNIAYEIAREGKTYTDEQIANRLIDATTVGTVMGGGMAAIAEATGQSARAYDQSKIADLELENSLRAAIKPRATTARILSPTASPDAEAGAQIADDAFRAAGVGTVAAADIAEQDLLARDLDAAQRDQLGSESEIDRLLTGGINGRQAQDAANGGNAGRPDVPSTGIGGLLPQGVRASYPGDTGATDDAVGVAGDGDFRGRDALPPQQYTELADGTVFVPGDPVLMRQRLAESGSQWRGQVREIGGVPGVRFGRDAWPEVQGVVGGNATSNSVGNAPYQAGTSDPSVLSRIAGMGAPIERAGGVEALAENTGGVPPVSAGGATQAAVAVDGTELGFRGASGDAAGVVADAGSAQRGAIGTEQTGEVASQPTPPALRDLTDDERNFWPALTTEIRTSIDNPGGRMIVNNDGTVGRTKWADLGPMSGFWRERPAHWNSDDVLTALDRAQSGEKLSVKQRNIVEYAKGWVRQYAADNNADLVAYEQDSKTAQRESVRDDIESTLASVADTSPQQRASVVSLGHDYTAKLIELKRARAAGALNPDQQEAYIDLLEQDRETGKVAGRPMVGIGNKSAYVDAQMQGKLMPVQVFLDADNFKALNDKFGHDVGDDAIRLIADVVRTEFGDGNVFHRGGDEFLTQGMTQEEVDAKMARVQSVLANYAVDLPLSDGRTATLEGIGVSYGTGANEKAADDSLKQDKQRRKEAGLRFDRREGDGVGRVGSGTDGAGTDASRANANPQDRTDAAAEGVGDVRTTRQSDAGGVGARGDSGTQAQPESSDAQSAGRADGVAGLTESTRTEQAESGLTVAEFNAELARAYDPRFPSRLARISIIAPTWRDVPQKYRDEVKADGADIRLVAGFVASDGTIVLIPGNMQRGEGVGVTIHEVGVHAWMAKNPAFRELLSDFKAARSRIPAVEAAFKRAESVADRDKNGNLTAAAKATLDEEAFAYYVEQNWNVKSPLMTRIKDAIARLLNRLGIPTSGITDALMRQALDGMVQAARESADAATRGAVTVRDGKIVYHKAWHGSPHDFDKFRLDDSTIGTGEGAQAFGFGLYFAGRKELGEHYRKQLSISQQTLKDLASPYDDAGYSDEEAITKLRRAADVARRNERNGEAADYDETARWIESGRPVNFGGRLYEVELAPTEDQYLDWDAPLSEQSEKVRGVMLPLVADEVSRRNAERERMNALSPGRLTHPVISKLATKVSTADSITGQSAYESLSKKLGGDRQASAALHAAGIPGIRYLDGSSRGGKTGWRVKFKNGQYSGKVFDTKAEADAAVERGEYNMVDRVEKIDDLSHNFVIFDDSQVEVKAKYSRRADGGGSVARSDKMLDIPSVEIGRGGRAPAGGIYVSGRLYDGGNFLPEEYPGGKSAARKLAAKVEGNIAELRVRPASTFDAGKAWIEVKMAGQDRFRILGSSPLDSMEKAIFVANEIVSERDKYYQSRGVMPHPTEVTVAGGEKAPATKYSRSTITVDGKQRPTTDSTGKAIHPTEDGIRNFWRWFGDSKVVDDQGRPLVVYHATSSDFDEFSEQKRSDGFGFYFGTTEKGAKKAAKGKARVIAAYLRAENIAGSLGAPRADWLQMRYDGVGASLAKDGFDGVWVKDEAGGAIVVRAPGQIKSTGNSGAFSPTDPRIAYSRKTPAEARAESAQKQADLGAQLVVSPGQSFVYVDQFTDDWRGQALKMRERIQDKLLSVRNVQKDIEQIRGAIEDAANVYRRENLMHGRVGDQRDKLQDNHVKPLIEAMAEAKVSPALLEDYLEARHAKERNEKIAAIKGGMPDGASGMTTAQAEDFLQGRAAGHRSGVTLDPAMTRQVSRLARKVDAITSETRRRLLDSGQITQDTFDALESAYAAYVPLRGKDGTESGKGRGTGKGIDVRGKPVLRAAGRGEGNRAQNILAEVIADAERSIINAEKLRVGRTLARLVLENPNPDVWEIEPVRTELKVSDGTPEEIYEAVKNLDQEEGTIIVKVKGKPYRIVFADNPGGKRMADAMKNMAVETVPEVIQYVAGLNRYFSAVLTRYNPSFVGVNMTRDLLFGMTGIWAEHGTGAALTAAKSYFPAMRAAWRDIQGKPPVNAMGRYAREFAEAGGKTYFGKLENVSDMSQRIGEEFKTFRQMAMPKMLGGESSPVRALAKVARDSKMVQAIEAVNDTVENTLRLSVYAARREAGASIEQAAEYAKNISVNFNRRGSATSWLNALYLFFNAATQGAHRTLTLLKNPKVQGVLGGLAALQATSAMFLMGLDDEDGEPLWDSISPWDKQRNLILAIPIKREKGWGATVIKIPMPYGFNLFPYMGGRSVELARDLQEKPVGRAIADYTTDAVVGVAQAMSPIPFDDGWKAALPHWVRIFTVLSENKDDLGIPIRAGDQNDSFDKPRSASGRDDTPLPFKVAATALNRIGGGDDYTPPYAKFALDWAPEDLAYLFKTFAGGLGSNVVKSGTLTEKLVAGVPINFKDVPMLSSFVSNVDQRQATSSRYYDHKDDIEREIARQRDIAKESGEVGDNPMGIKIARNKSGAKVRRGEGYELEGKPGSLFDTYKQSEKDISRIRDEMRAAFNDQSISYTERIRKIDELKSEREEVQRELNAAWREQRKKQTR